MYFTADFLFSGGNMYEITTETHFSAAHRLQNYKGPCENLHGHNWLVKATVRCENVDERGIGIDFKDLKQILNEISLEFDHKDLNTIFDPLNINPSSEILPFTSLENFATNSSNGLVR